MSRLLIMYKIITIGTSSSNVVMSRINDVGMFIKVDRNLTDNENVGIP